MVGKDEILIGQIGCGTVGSGVVKIIRENQDIIAKRVGYGIRIAGIALKSKSEEIFVDTGDAFITDNAYELTDHPEIDIIIEVMGGIEPARTFIARALENGKHVVTANKALISTHGDILLAISESKNVDLCFEASVGGAIPIIESIKKSLTGNRISEILGIVNGTTNYILSRMNESGLTYEEALEEASALGYAEANPSDDVEGRDAAAKIAILASIAFNARMKIDDIYTEGITRVTTEDMEFAKDMGYVIKLLAIAKEEEDGIGARVHPTMIPLGHPLAAVNDVFNAVFVKCDAAGDLMYYGRGAGSLPAASAVVGDVIEISRHIGKGGRTIGCTCFAEKNKKSIEETSSSYYMLMEVVDAHGVLARIASVFADNEVSIKSVLQRGIGGIVRLILITHLVSEKSIRKTLKELNDIETIHEIKSVIRVEA